MNVHERYRAGEYVQIFGTSSLHLGPRFESPSSFAMQCRSPWRRCDGHAIRSRFSSAPCPPPAHDFRGVPPPRLPLYGRVRPGTPKRTPPYRLAARQLKPLWTAVPNKFGAYAVLVRVRPSADVDVRTLDENHVRRNFGGLLLARNLVAAPTARSAARLTAGPDGDKWGQKLANSQVPTSYKSRQGSRHE